MPPRDFTSDRVVWRAWRDSINATEEDFFFFFVSYAHSVNRTHQSLYLWHTPIQTRTLTHSNKHTGCQVCPLINLQQWQIWSLFFYIFLIASESQPTLCKNKLTWHPIKWSLWNGNVCHTKLFFFFFFSAERLFVFVIFHCATPWMIDFL